MRSIRKTVDRLLPAAGITIILAAVLLLGQHPTLQLIVVIAGIVLIQAGMWHLAHPLLPNQRKYAALRAEVDSFIDLVRRLNTAAERAKSGNAGNAGTVAEVRREMLGSVDRMVEFAGRETPRDVLASR